MLACRRGLLGRPKYERLLALNVFQVGIHTTSTRFNSLNDPNTPLRDQLDLDKASHNVKIGDRGQAIQKSPENSSDGPQISPEVVATNPPISETWNDGQDALKGSAPERISLTQTRDFETPPAQVIPRKVAGRAKKVDIVKSTTKPLQRSRLDARRLLTPRLARKYVGLPRPPSRASPAAHKSNLGDEAVAQRSVEPSKRAVEIYWKEVLKLLTAMPIEPNKLDHRNGVFLSLDTIIKLTGVTHENLWIHPVRDGCQIHVQNHHFERGGKRLVLLSGSERAVDLTKQYLLRAEQSLHSDTVKLTEWINGDNTNMELSSGKSKMSSRRASRVEVTSIQEPEEWTVKTFAEYVDALVSNTSSTHIRNVMIREGQLQNLPALYRTGDSLDKIRPFHVIAARLDQLFSHPDLKYCISSRAQHDALEFFLRYYGNRPDRALKIISPSPLRQDIEIRTKVWNKILDTALPTVSIGIIKSLFDFAREAGISVDASTGLLIYRKTKSSSVKLEVYQWLVSNNFLNNMSDIRRFTREIAGDLCISHFQSGGSIRSFFQAMDDNLGPEWLSSKTLSRIFDMCSKHKFREQAEELWQVMSERGIRHSTHNVSHMLMTYYRCSRITDSVKFLNSDMVRRVGREDRYAIPYVFFTAWNSLSYNLCRVLWHYACAKGILTYQMQQVVFWSLIRNSASKNSPWVSKNPRNQSWKLTASKVIVGVSLDPVKLAKEFPSLLQDSKDKQSIESSPSTIDAAVENPAKWILHAASEHRTEQKELVKTIMENDYKAVLDYDTDFKFSKLLQQAHDMDLQWKADRVWETKGLEWMIDNAITVPLKKRAVSLNLSAWKDHKNMTPHNLLEDLEMNTDADANADEIETQNENKNIPTSNTQLLANSDKGNRRMFQPLWTQPRLVSHD